MKFGSPSALPVGGAYLPALGARGLRSLLAVVALAVAVSACVGKSGATYSRIGDVPGSGLDASMNLDAPGSVALPCENNVPDGTETDVDCGGGTCGRCANGLKCAVATDCVGNVCTAGVCQALVCSNLAKDGLETDVDCGGLECSPCAQGKKCLLTRDCLSGTCTAGTCEMSSCTDRIKNGVETDIDCGGNKCPACPPRAGCAIARDCESGTCTAAHCAVASCVDGIKNGTETATDCGGSCPGCPNGQTCAVAADCADAVCTALACGAPSCTDLAKNGAETDVDCGGTCATKCATGKGCAANADCSAGVCTGGICQGAGCANSAKDGTETDIDCGGAACGKCFDGQACVLATDCDGLVCTAGKCVAPSCTDLIRNGTESDVNCGGSCPPCGATSKCNSGGDCASFVCTIGNCAPPNCADKIKNGAETDLDCGGGSGCGACGPGRMCVGGGDCMSGSCQGGLCQDNSCTDGVKNGTETDADCGGLACPRCDDGKICKVGTDCVNAVCPAAGMKCASPTCGDMVQNGSETGADCGGPCAPAQRCADGKGCGTGGDCVSGVCGAGGKCAVGTCTDAVKNGDETDVNCGGSCPMKCALGKLCGTSSANCVTGTLCVNGVCAAPTCDDTLKDGMETDLNCGGPDCGKCVDGKLCLVARDCASGVCGGTTTKTCTAPSCTDTVKNGTESDLNCGGACPKCVDGKICGVAADCASGVCTAGICAAPSCTDTVKNGTETDLNCGGSCPKCANGKLCGLAGDCTSGVCTGAPTKTCAVPTCTDTVKNGLETDTDCGGLCAPARACANNLMCLVPTDCQSSNCTAMKCAASGCQTCWKVQYQYATVSSDMKWSGQNFNIVKTGTSTAPLSDLKIRYWFAAKRSPATAPLSASCFSFPGGNSNVTFVFVPVSPARAGADTYLEVGFKALTSWAGGSSGVIQTGFHFNDFTTFAFPNGYSSAPTLTTLTDDLKVTLYDLAGNLVWGTEPPACAAGAACP